MKSLIENITPNENELKNEKSGVDLSKPGMLKQLSTRIKDEIDAYCAEAYDDGPRKHLGASLIGKECKRDLWYTFRHIKHKKHTGRQQRLFNRGHREEARFIEWLRGIGFQVWEEEDGKQHRIKACSGHFGGSLDGICKHPEAYYIDFPMLLEFKTSGTGSKFNNLVKNGVKVEKPQHYSQMSVYGKNYGFEYALYMCINKNDDDLHVEVVKLDWTDAERLEAKAEAIIFSQEPPPKLSEQPALQTCKFCDYHQICHYNATPDINCRSCRNAKPVDNGEWFCSLYNGNIPADFIPKACSEWSSIV